MHKTVDQADPWCILSDDAFSPMPISYPRPVLIAQYETWVNSKCAPAQQNRACLYDRNDKMTDFQQTKVLQQPSVRNSIQTRHPATIVNL